MHYATSVADRAAPSLDHVCPTREPTQPWLRHATPSLPRRGPAYAKGLTFFELGPREKTKAQVARCEFLAPRAWQAEAATGKTGA